MKWGYKIILFFTLIAVMAPLLSNDKPILLISNGNLSFPFLNEERIQIGENDFYIMPLIPYRAGASDAAGAGQPARFVPHTGRGRAGVSDLP